jgi:hypothetical protein
MHAVGIDGLKSGLNGQAQSKEIGEVQEIEVTLAARLP